MKHPFLESDLYYNFKRTPVAVLSFFVFLIIVIMAIFANIIDTYVFFYTAFYNSSDKYMSNNWIEIAYNQSIIKIIIGLLFFLPFYGIILNFIMKKMKKII